MSSLGLKAFLGLGAVAVVPLSSSFIFKQIEVSQILGGAEKISRQEVALPEPAKPADPMKKAMEMIGDGESGKSTTSTKGCFWLSDQGLKKLFVCVNGLESEGPLFLFRYDWKSKADPTKKVIKIVQKSGNISSRPSVMQFEGGGSEDLSREAQTSLAALWNEWKGSDFSPSICKLTKDGNSSSKYTMKCANQTKQTSTWSKQVSKNDMTLSEN